MKTFKLEIQAQQKNSEAVYYSANNKESIKAEDIYEAITKYLQVKGFSSTCVKVEETRQNA